MFSFFKNLFRKHAMSITTENLAAAVATIVSAVKAGQDREQALGVLVAEKNTVIATQAATIAADEVEITAATAALHAALNAPVADPVTPTV